MDLTHWVILVIIAAVLATNCFFELLLAAEFKDHRSNWEKDGRPFGYFWLNSPVGKLPHFGSFRATYKCFYKWLFITPDWVVVDTRAHLYLRALRLSAGTTVFLGVCLIALFGRFM